MKWMSFFVSVTLFGQTLEFEAAAIKPANPDQKGSGIRIEKARIKVINAPLRFMVQYAWNVKDFQVVGGPSWAGTERYDVDAVSQKPFEGDDLRMMIRALLADRFKLAVHTETQEKPGYALVIAKNGPKLPPAEDDRNRLFSRTASGDTTLTAKNVTMEEFASLLSTQLTAIVVDRTGLDGHFNCSFQWTPDQPTRPMISKSGEPIPAPPADAVPGPSIFTALQEKLGLKLESRKVPTEIIVIDRAEHPSAN
jgi:uncharacterized protein (TIGR03435 family)